MKCKMEMVNGTVATFEIGGKELEDLKKVIMEKDWLITNNGIFNVKRINTIAWED